MTPDRPFPVLYEDAQILAIEKPAGIASIPERDKEKGSVLTTLSTDPENKLYTVHRLDREVSGILMFAKDAETHKQLNKMFETRMVKKTYYAWVHGSISTGKGTINKAIRQFGSGRMGVDEERGRYSLTQYEVEKRQSRFTLLKVQPETGRRHQIRVHLYHIGHPVVGDSRYGDSALQSQFPRLMLHAAAVELPFPPGKRLSIESRETASKDSAFFNPAFL